MKHASGLDAGQFDVEPLELLTEAIVVDSESAYDRAEAFLQNHARYLDSVVGSVSEQAPARALSTAGSTNSRDT